MNSRYGSAPASSPRAYLHFRPLIAGFVSALLLACGNGDSTGTGTTDPIPAELAGDWRATADCAARGCVFVLTWEQPAATLDLLPQPFHAELDLQLQRSGAAKLELWTVDPDFRGTSTGTARTEGSLLLLEGSSGVDTLTFQLSGNLLSLRFHEEVEVAFRDDPAQVRAVLERR